MSSHRRPRRLLPALLVVLGLLALGACGSDGDEPAAADETPGDATFPVSIDHAFGTTVIPTAPTRVVTWGWGSADAAIALGVLPTAMPFQDYGGDDRGVLPWIAEALADAGAETPQILPNADDAPIEAIAAAKPDLILAVYSGITDAEYALLSKIAPTVAYPDQPWATPWRDTIEIVGTALGKAAEAKDLLADIDAAVAAQAEAHPELEGKTVALVWDTGDTFYVYKPADSRVAFTLDLGLVNAPSVDALATGDSTFYFTLSKERLPELTSDILVSYADTAEGSKAFLSSPSAKLMEQVQRGAVAEVVGSEFVASVSPPTALSLTWGLDDYVELLSKAAKAAS
jgi:iron complex transport system substrate-binding protein